MVRVDICQNCSHRMSEIWKEHRECEKCGSPIEKVDVDMGFSERAPRILMVGGISFSIFAFLFLIYTLITGDLGQDEGLTSMVMLLVGIGFFAASLVVRTQVSAKAMEVAQAPNVNRRTRMVKGSSVRGNEPVRSGSIRPPSKRTASKLPLDRKR